MHARTKWTALTVCLVAAGVMTAAGCAGPQPISSGRTPLEGKRIAFLATEGFHDGEALYPMGYLINRGAEVSVVGVEPGAIKAYNSEAVMHVHLAVTEVSIDHFDALVIPGGRSPARLRESEEIVSFVRDFFNSGKPVAAICHGPQVLVRAGVMQGRTTTCIAAISDEVEQAGATYRDEALVRDGNLITSRLPGDLPVFSAAIATALME